MDVTTMPSTPSLIRKLQADFPALTFKEAEDFSWTADDHTVSYVPKEPQVQGLLLHEVSHGLLNHSEYRRDVELIAMETAAWERAKDLAKTYDVPLNEELIQDNLDTYRDWLHDRSTCPECTATGYQTDKATYACPACSHNWRVNEARICQLRRYSLRT